MGTAKHVAFGVFDWGLGHATRSKPLAQALLDKGCSLDFISTGRALKVLREHFGDRCGYHDVPSIVSPYTKSEHFVLNFIKNGPKMLESLKEARRQSKALIEKNGYDLVVSDCRYDVYGEKKNSFLINHQLRFAAPAGAELFAEAWLAQRMSKYKKVIVPDYAGKDNLTGRLSHDLYFLKSRKVEYIGHLSHLKKAKKARDIEYFITLTGPEPQRSLLEEIVLQQAQQLEGKVVIAGGNPDKAHAGKGGTVEYHPYMNTEQMADCLNRCRFFVSRSGYTSMMELVELGVRRALLIPTPGQTEQEYLGKFYNKRGYFCSVTQKELNLTRDLKRASDCAGFEPEWSAEQSVKNFLSVVGF